MTIARNKQDVQAARQAARVKQNYIVFGSAPWWEIPDHIKVKLKIGVNWIDDALYVKHQNGTVLHVSWVLPTPPRADIEREGGRLLDETVAECQRLRQQSIWLRLERADPNTLTLDELRELCILKGIDVEAIQRRVREKVEQEKSNHVPGSSTASDAPEE